MAHLTPQRAITSIQEKTAFSAKKFYTDVIMKMSVRVEKMAQLTFKTT